MPKASTPGNLHILYCILLYCVVLYCIVLISLSQTCNLNVSKKNVNTVSEISEVTINKCYKKLYKIKDKLIPNVIINKYVSNPTIKTGLPKQKGAEKCKHCATLMTNQIPMLPTWGAMKVSSFTLTVVFSALCK